MILIRKILGLLTATELRRALLLLGMVLVMAFLDVIGVASIMPFMTVLANPGVIETNHYLKTAFTALGFSDSEDFLFFLGLVVFAALVISIAFKALTTWALLRFTNMRNYSLSKRLVAGYLHQPYEWFLNRHSADLGKTVLSEVQEVINGAVMPLMNLVAHGAVVIALLGLLIVVDPLLALYASLGLGLAYGGMYALLRKRLNRLGRERLNANRIRFETLSEAFGGIKEVKVGGLEEAFIGRYDGPAKRFASTQASAQAAAQLPRFAIEILTFGGMLLVVLYLMRNTDGLQGALPVIALYALAGYRLIPSLQQVYANFSKLRFAGPALDTLHNDLVSLAPRHKVQPAKAPLKLECVITLENVTYSYPKASHPALNGLNLEIPARSTIGLVGATGSGKTTMVDLILGLLQPQSGQFRVDDQPITAENRRAWQRSIGYVPQHIYLADDSVAANIAFGVPKDQLDQQAVERAARIANLHEFVIRDLSQGYNTHVGERGVRLSGGQRQRIGIARAMYHNPRVLILDEATSALDNITEQAVMDSVHNLSHEITIILIAHRLSTVRECDRIYLLEKGKVAGQGTYDELASGNPRFQDLLRAVGHGQ